MRNGLAGVGIRDTAGDDLGRLQRHRHLLRRPEVLSVSIVDILLANRGSLNAREAWRPRPMPCRVNRPSASVIAGLGQPGKSFASSPPEGRAFGSLTTLVRVSLKDAAHGRDRDRDIRGGPALQVEEAALDHLLGSERDIGVGLVGVGVELDPADPISGGQGDGADTLIPR